MSATHNDLIQIDINLAAPPATSTDFAAMAFFAIDQPFGSGARSKSYQSYSALNADSANLSANALAAGLAAFSQSRAPSVFTVVHVDDIGGETYADAWDAFVVTGVSFFLVATESRAVADHEDIAGRLESYKKAFGCFQSSAIVTAGTVDKTAYDAFKAREYSMGIYHDTDTELSTLTRSQTRTPDVFRYHRPRILTTPRSWPSRRRRSERLPSRQHGTWRCQ